MGKTLRKIILIILAVLLVVGFIEYKAFSKKKEMRREGMVYFQEEDYVKALQYFRKALDKHCLFAGTLNNDIRCYMAESHYCLEEYDEAMEICEKLISSGSDDPACFLISGKCYQEKKEYQKAVDIYQKGFDKTGDVTFLENTCEIFLMQEDYDSALSYAQEGLKKGGSSKGTLMYELIIIYEHTQDYQKAYEAAKEYCELFPEDEKGKKELDFLSTRIGD